MSSSDKHFVRLIISRKITPAEILCEKEVFLIRRPYPESIMGLKFDVAYLPEDLVLTPVHEHLKMIAIRDGSEIMFTLKESTHV